MHCYHVVLIVMICVFGFWLLLLKRYPKSICLFAEHGSDSYIIPVVPTCPGPHCVQVVIPKSERADRLRETFGQIQSPSPVENCAHGGHRNCRIFLTIQQGFSHCTCTPYLDGTHSAHGMPSTKRRCGSFFNSGTRWKECWHLWLWVVGSWNAQLDWNERNGPDWSIWQRLHM